MRKITAIGATAFLCLALKMSFAQPVRIMSDIMSHHLMTDGSGQASIAQFQPDMLAHSPEAEQMVKSVTMPMTLYTGMPNISIPIYDLKTRSLDIPISLAFNYNGFKPAEVAGYAGLGWSVEGGGVITRMVKSRVDHDDFHVSGNDYDNYVNINLITAKQVILQNTALGMVDGEPDIYVFSCPGMSGKFIWLQGEAYMFPYQRIRVTGSPDAGFVLTKENGDQYTFDQTEMTHHHQLLGTDYVPDHTSAWFLSRVVSADKADTVNYTYTGYTFTQPPVYSEVYTASTAAGASVTPNSPQTLTETASNGDYVHSLLLSTISYKDVTVSFGLDGTPRQDIYFQDGSVYRLASIIVQDAGISAVNKHFNLQHTYYNGKLSLVEVDEFSPKGETGQIDSTTFQRTQFQYIGDTGISYIPGFNTRSIDKFGYYNGANNAMLFTTDDVANSAYSPADRTPSLGECELGMMTRMTHPTGGYTTFDYELNHTGHYIVTGQYQDVYTSMTATVNWPGTDPGPPEGYYETHTDFTIADKQAIKIAFSVNTPAQLTDSVMWLKNFNTGQMLMYVASEPAGQFADTLYMEDSLDAGTYSIYVKVDKKGAVVTATPVFYNREPIIDNTLGDAPGVRVKTITHYDNATAGVPALVKQFTYSDGAGLFKNGTSARVTVRHATGCYPAISDSSILTLQAGLFAPISNVLNNQFYYQYVEEADIGPTNIGKKVYTFNCFAPDEPDVFQTSETYYGYGHGIYYPLHKSVSKYQLHDKYGFQTFTTTLTDQINNGEGCAFVPTTDQTQPVSGVPNLYAAVRDQLISGYKTLQSITDSTWDMHGENPVVTESDYYYDNPSYIYPTRVKKANSKGQTETTYFKYVPDYLPAGGTSLAGLDSSWITLQNNAILPYNLCYDSLVSALQPYQPYTSYPTQFTAVANSYDCEDEYKQNSNSAYAARNTQFASYLSALNSAAYNDPTTWRRAIYRLASDNAIGTLVEQYKTVVLGDGNEYLVDAVRNDFSLMNDAAGDTVVKQTQTDESELSAPLLYSTFTAGPDNYYKQQIAMSYDRNMVMISQHKVNNVKYNYLWGYNHRFPVAEVEGSDSATIAGMINQSVLDNPSSDQALRNELNKIRTGLQGTKALVTTSTYDPLAGMTSKTDAAGRTTYFEYDAMGRLADIKDLNGNIIKTYRYHVVN